MVSILFFQQIMFPPLDICKKLHEFSELPSQNTMAFRLIRETQRSQAIWKEVAAILGETILPEDHRNRNHRSVLPWEKHQPGKEVCDFDIFVRFVGCGNSHIQNLFGYESSTVWGGVYLFYSACVGAVTLCRLRCWCEHNLSKHCPTLIQITKWFIWWKISGV